MGPTQVALSPTTKYETYDMVVVDAVPAWAQSEKSLDLSFHSISSLITGHVNFED
jgi:hypothetical protein